VAGGVSVEVGEEEAATMDLAMAVEYGVSIPQVTEAARRNVINRVESLVGLRVTEDNMTVNAVQFPEERPIVFPPLRAGIHLGGVRAEEGKRWTTLRNSGS
jgi:uncharacterized alkaline shock family protein YloU